MRFYKYWDMGFGFQHLMSICMLLYNLGIQTSTVQLLPIFATILQIVKMLTLKQSPNDKF